MATEKINLLADPRWYDNAKPAKPQIWQSHEANIPEEAEMIDCEDCLEHPGLDGFDDETHRAYACATCAGHGVLFILYPATNRKPACPETIPWTSVQHHAAPTPRVASIGNGLYVRTGKARR